MTYFLGTATLDLGLRGYLTEYEVGFTAIIYADRDVRDSYFSKSIKFRSGYESILFKFKFELLSSRNYNVRAKSS